MFQGTLRSRSFVWCLVCLHILFCLANTLATKSIVLNGVERLWTVLASVRSPSSFLCCFNLLLRLYVAVLCDSFVKCARYLRMEFLMFSFVCREGSMWSAFPIVRFAHVLTPVFSNRRVFSRAQTTCALCACSSSTCTISLTARGPRSAPGPTAPVFRHPGTNSNGTTYQRARRLFLCCAKKCCVTWDVCFHVQCRVAAIRSEEDVRIPEARV